MKKGDRGGLLINGLSAVWGGGVVYLKQLLSSFSGDIHFIANKNNKKDFEPLLKTCPGLKIHWVVAENYLQKLKFYLIDLPALCKKLAIKTLYEPANLIYLKPKGVKVVLCIQNLAPFFNHPVMQNQKFIWKIRWIVLKWLTLRSLSLADSVLFISQFGKELLSSQYPKFKIKFNRTILYHGCPDQSPPDEEEFKTFSAAHSLSPQFIFTPSHLLWYKNIETVLEAMPLLKKSFPDLHYVVAGNYTTPDYWRFLKEKAARLGLEGSVHFPGEVNRTLLGEFYKRCRLVAFPSLVENMPFTLLESLSYGCPIVAGDTGVMPEVLFDSGILVPPTSPEAYYSAIKKILDSPGLEISLKKASLERARFFSWERNVADLGGILRGL